jgi:hypothetical protein
MLNHTGLFRRVLTTAMLLAGTGAAAADRHWTVEGGELHITTPCAKDVTIEPSAGLNGRIEVDAHADHQQEVDQLNVSGGSVATLARKASCWLPGPNLQIGDSHIGLAGNPTMTVTVTVPQGIAIAIKEGGRSDYRIGAVGGALRLDLQGSGSVEAETATELSFSLTGSGDARIDQVGGHIDGKISGSGDLAVSNATAASTSLTVSGSGDARIDRGEIGAVKVALQGSGNFSGPDAGDVTLESSGSGSFSLRSVKAASISLRVGGNGDVKLGDGTIGSLVVISSGSADVGIEAIATDADLSLRGSGDIEVRRVAGKLSRSEHGSGRITIGDK